MGADDGDIIEKGDIDARAAMRRPSFAKKFRDPEILLHNLRRASLYLFLYELLWSSVVDEVCAFFFTTQYQPQLSHAQHAYATSVLAKHKKMFEASTIWLKEQGALTSTDVSELQRLRAHRDQIAHDLPRLLMRSRQNVSNVKLRKAIALLKKIDNHWCRLRFERDSTNRCWKFLLGMTERVMVAQRAAEEVLAEFHLHRHDAHAGR